MSKPQPAINAESENPTLNIAARPWRRLTATERAMAAGLLAAAAMLGLGPMLW